MNRDGFLALGRALVRYLVGLLIGGLVLDSMERKRIGRKKSPCHSLYVIDRQTYVHCTYIILYFLSMDARRLVEFGNFRG